MKKQSEERSLLVLGLRFCQRKLTTLKLFAFVLGISHFIHTFVLEFQCLKATRRVCARLAMFTNKLNQVLEKKQRKEEMS